VNDLLAAGEHPIGYRIMVAQDAINHFMNKFIRVNSQFIAYVNKCVTQERDTGNIHLFRHEFLKPLRYAFLGRRTTELRLAEHPL